MGPRAQETSAFRGNQSSSRTTTFEAEINGAKDERSDSSGKEGHGDVAESHQPGASSDEA